MGLVRSIQEYWSFLTVGFTLLFLDFGWTGLKRKVLRTADPEKAKALKALQDAGDRSGYVAIVTGANSGIGLEISRQLAGIGYKVILGCRSEKNAAEAMEKIKAENSSRGLPADLEFVQIDMSSTVSVKGFANTIKEKGYKVNLLVNNAGIMFLPKHITSEGFESHFAVNFLSPFVLSMSLLDVLEKSGPSRIINLSSGTASWSSGIPFDNLNAEKDYHRWWAYCDSKLMITTISIEMGRRLAKNGYSKVSVFVGHPGSVTTAIARNAGFLMHLHELAVGPISRTAEEGSYSTIWTALAPEFDGQTGLYFDKCEIAPPPKLALDNTSANKLWDTAKRLGKMENIKW